MIVRIVMVLAVGKFPFHTISNLNSKKAFVW